jgi:hypothetical protein
MKTAAFVVAVAALTVAGCEAISLQMIRLGRSGDNEHEQEQATPKAMLTCENVDTQLNFLLPLRDEGRLPQTALTILDKQMEITAPFCRGASPTLAANASYAAATVDAAARSLAAITLAFDGT